MVYYKLRWIAKATSGLHDLFPSFQKSRKINFRESNAAPENLEVNFTNIAEPGTYSYKGNWILPAVMLA